MDVLVRWLTRQFCCSCDAQGQRWWQFASAEGSDSLRSYSVGRRNVFTGNKNHNSREKMGIADVILQWLAYNGPNPHKRQLIGERQMVLFWYSGTFSSCKIGNHKHAVPHYIYCNNVDQLSRKIKSIWIFASQKLHVQNKALTISCTRIQLKMCFQNSINVADILEIHIFYIIHEKIVLKEIILKNKNGFTNVQWFSKIKLKNVRFKNLPSINLWILELNWNCVIFLNFCRNHNSKKHHWELQERLHKIKQLILFIYFTTWAAHKFLPKVYFFFFNFLVW